MTTAQPLADATQPSLALRAIPAPDAAARPRRLRLANVVHSLGPGGTEKLVLEMSLAFAGEFDVEVVCLDAPGAWSQELHTRGIPVTCVSRRPGVDVATAFRLALHFRLTKPDIVHTHQCTPWIYAAMSRLLYPAPRLLLEEHGRFFPEVESRRRIVVNRLLLRRLTHRFVAVSEDVRRRIRRYEGLDSERIEVIYNGVRPPVPIEASDRAALRSSLGFGDRDFVIGTAGRFDPIKNLPLLIEALACVGADSRELRGLLVGDGPELERIRSLIDDQGLAGRVRLTGHRDDARRLIACMDLFVLSSFSEGTSVALLEAMAAGVPAIVTDVGGNPEIVLDGRTGWVVPSDSVDGMVTAILEAMANAGLRQRRAVAGQHRYHARFAFDRMIARYRQLYESLCPIEH